MATPEEVAKKLAKRRKGLGGADFTPAKSPKKKKAKSKVGKLVPKSKRPKNTDPAQAKKNLSAADAYAAKLKKERLARQAAKKAKKQSQSGTLDTNILF